MPATASVLAFYCSSLSWGGLEMNSLRFAIWMSQRGYRVLLYAVAGSPLAEKAKTTSIEVLDVPRNRKYFDFRNALRLARRFKKDGVHTVWYRDNRDLDTLGWAKRLSGNRFRIVYQQAMQLGVSKRDPIHTFRFNAIDRWIAPLQFLAEEVKSKTRFSPNKIHVIPLAIDIAAFENGVGDRNACRKKFGLDQESIWIGIAGRIDRLKGQHLAIEALARMASDFPNVKLVIAGEPTRGEPTEYADSLRTLVDALQLDSKVLFLPFTQEVSSFYTAIDICAMTSVGETFGMVTIEAMMRGCAVVGTNSSGTPELLHHGELGMLFEPGSSEGLESALRKLIENPDLRHRLGSKAKSFAQQQFSHALVCRRIAQEVLGPMGLKSTE